MFNVSGRSAATVISVTRRGPPLANFDPNGYGKQRNADQYGGNKSTHILQTPTLLMLATQAAQVWSELLMTGRR
jgi:hypothetical protein